MSTFQSHPRLVLYGHSWVAGEAATRPERRFSEVTAASLGMTPVNLGVGGSSTIDTASHVSRHSTPRADAYLLLAGLNDARLNGCDPAALDAYSTALETIVTACEAVSPNAVVLLVAQPPLLDYSGYPPHNRGSDSALAAYNQRLRVVADRHPQAVMVHVDRWEPTTMLDDDAVHPNDAGHAVLAAAAIRAYRRAVSIGSTSPVQDCGRAP
jgi:lysophospholipase L1-like esterase